MDFDDIRNAEATLREAVKKAAELRQSIENAGVTDPATRARLIEAAEKFEADVQRLEDYVREWKKEIQ